MKDYFTSLPKKILYGLLFSIVFCFIYSCDSNTSEIKIAYPETPQVKISHKYFGARSY
jgi:hypothetical protein